MSPEHKKIDGNDFLENQLELLSFTKTWGGLSHDKYPHGTIVFPEYTDLVLNSTFRVPARVCLQGDPKELHAFDLPGIVASPEGVWGSSLEDSTVLYSEKGYNNEANWNSNFGTHYHNFFINCNHVADGPVFGGAQVSSIENLHIYFAKSNGLTLAKGTSRTLVQKVDVQNRRSYGDTANDRIGSCFMTIGTNNVTYINCNGHMSKLGFDCIGVSNLQILGSNMEKVDTPFSLTEGSKSVWVQGADLQYTSDVVIDLTKNRGNIYISGTLRKSPQQTYYRDFFGKLKPFITGATSSVGKDFTFRVKRGILDAEIEVYN